MSVISYNGNIPLYRFYVSGDTHTVSQEVFPLNFLKTSLVDEKERGMVSYRRKYNGKLTFGSKSKVTDEFGVLQDRSDDFDYFWNIEQTNPCERLDFLITKTVSGVTTTYFEGYFSTTNGEWDIDKCLFTVTPITDDDYSIWLDNGDREYNMFDLGLTLYNTSITINGVTWSYTRNYLIVDLLEYIINDILPGTTLASDFLTAAANPVTLGQNRFDVLTIAQKSDIKYPGAAIPASVGMLSFNKIMHILRCLNLRWDYDGTDIIVEHVSYFVPAPGGIDIRTQALAVASNKYKYLKEDMPKYERFNWMEADTEFSGLPIEYDSQCVNQDPYSNFTELMFDVSTDIIYINNCMADPDLNDTISNDGFVLLCNNSNSVRVGHIPVINETRFNGDLSWYSLHEYFFRHDMSIIDGILNGIATTFYSAKKTKQQDVSVVLCDTFDPNEEITTELGEDYFGVKAWVKRAEMEPTGLTKLNLVYGPDDTPGSNSPANTLLVMEWSDAVAEESFFYVIASEEDTVDNIVRISVLTDPSGLWVTDDVTIPAGDFGATTTIAWTGGDTCVDDVTVNLLVSNYALPTTIIRDPLTDCP